MCQGRGAVKSYRMMVEKTTDPEEPIEGNVYMQDLKAFGNSKSPF